MICRLSSPNSRRRASGFAMRSRSGLAASKFRSRIPMETRSSFLAPRRQGYGEGRTRTEPTLDRDFPAMDLHNTTHDIEPQADALRVGADPFEKLEDLRMVLLIEADSVVLHLNLRLIRIPSDQYLDRFSGSEFHRV